MEQFKRAKVIMLPTEKISNICLGTNLSYVEAKNGKTLTQIWEYIQEVYPYKPQHLYIISDDEIKNGDWCINENNNIFQYIGGLLLPTDKKIIATTDTSLKEGIKKYSNDDIKTFEIYNSLPQPSQQFIEKYIECYNRGEVITDVLVEYNYNKDLDDNWDLTKTNTPKFENKLEYDNFINSVKINPKDNTITIKKLKDSWNKEEHISNLIKYRKDYEQFKKDSHFGPNETEINNWSNKWIEENL
jgi:hypothetical protein